MKFFNRLLATFLLISGTAVSAADLPRDPQKFFFDESFWDMKEELEIAKEKGKKGIMIMFTMTECPFCHRMKTMVLNQPDVQDYYKKNFQLFEVDIEGDVELVNFKGESTTMKDFAFKEYRVRATPVFAFFDLEGNYIPRSRFTGATKNKEEFNLLGKYVLDKAYEKEAFARYKRANLK